MIIVPEIKTAFITPPRTGSTAVREALCARYPKAIVLYRHMEADGVPHGYDRWRRVGFCRAPVDRLISLYKYLSHPKSESRDRGTPAWQIEARRVGSLTFQEWLRDEWVFTSPYDSAGSLDFWPGYNVLHSLPEQRKSQYVYLRPDLGVEVFPYSKIGYVMEHEFDAPLRTAVNASEDMGVRVKPTDLEWIEKRHGWDMENS